MKIVTSKETTIIHGEGIQITFPSADLFRHFNQAFLADMLGTVLERIGIDRKKASQYAQNPDFIERWLEAVANDETIAACMNQLVAECVKAEEYKNELPMFKTGDIVTYSHDKTGFPDTEPELTTRSGKTVTVLRELTKDEYDKADVGTMYKVQFMDGYVADVFEDELSWTTGSEGSFHAQGSHYLPIYRDGIPMLIRFSDISKGDEVILKLGDNTTVYCNTPAKYDCGSWFFHDKKFCPYFPKDFPLCKNYAANVPSVNYFDSVNKVNAVLERSDEDHAAAELQKNGFNKEILASLGFAFLWENRIITDFNDVTDGTAANPVPHEFVKNLAQYKGGMLNGPQLRELCSYFTVMADVAILLSPDFRVFFRNSIIPKLQDEEMRLNLECRTIDCISGLAATPGPLWDHAIGAKELLIDLHNRSLLCTRHAAVDCPALTSSQNVADAALANFIHQGKNHPVCLFTNNPYLVNQILTEENAPKCICVGFNKDNEFFIHAASMKRLEALCWPQKGGEQV